MESTERKEEAITLTHLRHEDIRHILEESAWVWASTGDGQTRPAGQSG